MSLNTTKKINYSELIDTLVSALPERERDVLVKRYCLQAGQQKKATLEKIGSDYNITRERVRQIENEALRKVSEIVNANNQSLIKELLKQIETLLAMHGGFIAQNHLKNHLLSPDQSEQEKMLEFLLEKAAAEHIDNFEHPELDIIWRASHLTDDQLITLAKAVNQIIEKQNKPLAFEEIVEHCKNHECFAVIDALPAENHYIIEAILRSRADVKKNILNQWGKSEWTTITPKRMTDKAYLILQREGKPLHFADCAKLINEANFDRKKACAATVHNELIMDDKYVLVGRGMYALKDWGYQAGTVSDLIAQAIAKNGPLTKEQIIEKILGQRFVKKTTIMLALMNKEQFEKKSDGTYVIIKK